MRDFISETATTTVSYAFSKVAERFNLMNTFWDIKAFIGQKLQGILPTQKAFNGS